MEETIQFNVHRINVEQEKMKKEGSFNLTMWLFMMMVPIRDNKGTEIVSTVVHDLDVEEEDLVKAIDEIDELNLTQGVYLVFFKFQEKSFCFRLVDSLTESGERMDSEDFLNSCIDLFCHEIES